MTPIYLLSTVWPDLTLHQQVSKQTNASKSVRVFYNLAFIFLPLSLGFITSNLFHVQNNINLTAK